MPLVTISMRCGKSEDYRSAIMDGVHAALHETFSMPNDNGFMVINEIEASNFRYSPGYMGVSRSDDLVIVHISAIRSRTAEQKKALYRRMVEHLTRAPGLRAEDLFVNITEGEKENWSLGRGLAQYA
ncbi:tautomerase family protein [Actibacterium sp. XHP0104]|uniref:tautomerase family protein n=1 Tax=Actibacterium sp. XHP0104 TaxID=2984335 RepID=UPI0021E9A529|nr:tautomerase family protein [Actibacterium sp. XHP0104]MCV2880426.1 tautomerase family protein [Actibacterium sp. XHP0104]